VTIWSEPRFLACGDRALSVELGDEITRDINARILALEYLLQQKRVPGVGETVPSYRALLAERRAYDGDAGPIVDGEGRQVGTHSGYAHYTVGQRRGLGLAGGEARYVREIHPDRNEVVVGAREDLATTAFVADGRHFVAGAPPAERFEADVRIRHRSADVACEVTMVGVDRLVIETAESVWAPAPGQSAVLYQGDECLGGGRIIRS